MELYYEFDSHENPYESFDGKNFNSCLEISRRIHIIEPEKAWNVIKKRKFFPVVNENI